MKKVLTFVYFFFCASMLFSITALAYIDPSAMTYMIQLIAGIAIAAGAGFGFYFRKIRRRLSKFAKKDRSADFVSYDDDDDDMTGFGDYEIEDAAGAGIRSKTGAAAPDKSAVSADIAVPAFESLAEAAASAVPAPDPFDEAGGEGGLAAENERLRRLLAEERQKVALLKQALHICTAPGK